MKNMLMDQIKEYGIEGAGGAAPVVDPAKPAEPVVDDLGYAQVDPVPVEPIVAPEPAKVEPVVEEVKDPATGYIEDPAKVVEPAKPAEPAKVEDPAKPAEPAKVDDPAPSKDFELKNIDGLLANELEEIKSFAKKHGVTQEVAQALVDLKQDEVKKLDVAFEAQKVEAKANKERIRGEHIKELKDDPDFGGEKFDASVKKAEKVLGEYMPNTKKQLTKEGGMLPPYVMRDLAKLSDHLYSNKPLVKGEPLIPGQKEGDSKTDSPLDFYV